MLSSRLTASLSNATSLFCYGATAMSIYLGWGDVAMFSIGCAALVSLFFYINTGV